jgi:hypothetical protein
MPPPFDAVGELAEYLSADKVHTPDLHSSLAIAETLLGPGGQEVVDLVVAGFLEDLQNIASFPDTALDSSTLVSLLPPRCAQAAEDLNRRWTATWGAISGAPAKLTLDNYRSIESGDVRRMFRRMIRVMPDGRLVAVSDVLIWETRRDTRQ